MQRAASQDAQGLSTARGSLMHPAFCFCRFAVEMSAGRYQLPLPAFNISSII